MAKTITLKETQASYATVIEQVKSTGEPLVVEQDGQPFAVVIPFAEYQQLVALRESERQKASQESRAEARHRAYQESFEQERAAFYRLKPQLLKTHRDQYVAVHGSQVVDSDADDAELAKRVMAKYPHQAVYIQLVSEELPSFELPSPEEFAHA